MKRCRGENGWLEEMKTMTFIPQKTKSYIWTYTEREYVII